MGKLTAIERTNRAFFYHVVMALVLVLNWVSITANLNVFAQVWLDVALSAVSWKGEVNTISLAARLSKCKLKLLTCL